MGPAVESTGCSCTGAGFNSRHPHGSSPSVTRFPGDLMSSSDLLEHQAYTWCAGVDARKTLTQEKKLLNIFFVCVPTPMFYTLLK